MVSKLSLPKHSARLLTSRISARCTCPPGSHLVCPYSAWPTTWHAWSHKLRLPPAPTYQAASMVSRISLSTHSASLLPLCICTRCIGPPNKMYCIQTQPVHPLGMPAHITHICPLHLPARQSSCVSRVSLSTHSACSHHACLAAAPAHRAASSAARLSLSTYSARLLTQPLSASYTCSPASH